MSYYFYHYKRCPRAVAGWLLLTPGKQSTLRTYKYLLLHIRGKAGAKTSRVQRPLEREQTDYFQLIDSQYTKEIESKVYL